ncbi:uncharacterized protein BDV14DRAFT_198882 [Aspergillus stella-maris]|uniref:uncharacterized protein n=1 Tax=Aspergillus stella-maris TaxID=1810926 RepID=UPI003CCCFA37
MASNTNHPSGNDECHRIMLLGTPEVALNQLPDILNIHTQPNVVICEEKGDSSFDHRLLVTIENQLLKQPVETWTESDIKTLQDESMRDLEAIEEAAATANDEVKILFAQVDPSNILNPAALNASSSGQSADKTTDAMKATWKRFDLDGPEGYERPRPTQPNRPPRLIPENIEIVFLISDPVIEFPLAYSDITLDIRHGWIPKDMVNPLMKLTCTYRWMAALHECHDITGRATKVCEILGLDPGLIRFEGMEIAQENHEEAIALEKPGLQRFLAPGMNALDARIADCRDLWEDEFGEEAAGVLERCVRDAIPGYEAMYARRLR